MKISSKGRYALRIMLDLAIHDTGSYISLKAVAQRQEISDKYAEQIIQKLSKANLVLSTRGAQGGYKLAHTPNEMTVGDILRAVEDNLAPVSCMNCQAPCDKLDSCLTIGLYKKIQDAIYGVVDNTTLQDMLNEYNSNSKNAKGCII